MTYIKSLINHKVEVINRFKGLDLIDSILDELGQTMTLYRRQESRSSPTERNAKSKMAV